MILRLIVLISFLTLNCVAALSQIADSWAGGNGTKEDPYRIADISQLRKLACDVNSGNSYEGIYFVLVKDVRDNDKVLDDDGLISDFSNLREWIPIGKSSDTPFQGCFNGNGYVIYGLSGIKKFPELYKEDDIFLFGYIENSIISNVVLDDSYVVSMIWTAKNSEIISCINYGYAWTGIMLGRYNHTGNTLIKNCGNYGKVNTAGITDYGKECRFVNCFNYGPVEDILGVAMGGLVARQGSCFNCMNLGNINASNNSCSGIVCWATEESELDSDVAVSNVVNYGSITPLSKGCAIVSSARGSKIFHVENSYALEGCNNKLFGRKETLIEEGENKFMTEDEMKSKEFLDKLNENAAKLGNGCCGWKFGKDGFPVLEIVELDEDAAVNQIDSFSGEENNDNNVIYYNLQGIRINVPAHGFYLKVCGNSVEKKYIP